MVIFDTNILVKLYHGNEQTREAVLALDDTQFYISAITVAEFLVGARNKQEMRAIRKQLNLYTVLPITEDTSNLMSSVRSVAHHKCLLYRQFKPFAGNQEKDTKKVSEKFHFVLKIHYLWIIII